MWTQLTFCCSALFGCFPGTSAHPRPALLTAGSDGIRDIALQQFLEYRHVAAKIF